MHMSMNKLKEDRDKAVTLYIFSYTLSHHHASRNNIECCLWLPHKSMSIIAFSLLATRWHITFHSSPLCSLCVSVYRSWCSTQSTHHCFFQHWVVHIAEYYTEKESTFFSTCICISPSHSQVHCFLMNRCFNYSFSTYFAFAIHSVHSASCNH